MRWEGKIIGALLGLVAGPFGAAVGAVIGHGYDLSREQSTRAGAAGDGTPPQEVRELLFATAFGLMGHLAKIDGRVSEQEIGAAREIMRQMQLGPDDVQRAIDNFNRGKEPHYPVAGELARLRAACGPRHELLRMLLEIEVRAALAGNDLEGPVRGALAGIAHDLGFTGLELAALEAALRLQQGRGQRASPARPGVRLATAYEVLGIAAAASDDAVKKAYRRQMNDNHPDKLIARGLPESMQELAKQKTQRIREAYEVICEARGLR